MLCNMVATNYMWIFTFKLNEMKLNFSFPIALATLQVPLVALVATVMDRADTEHFHYNR